MLGGVGHAIETPAGAGRDIVGNLKDIVDIGDDRLAVCHRTSEGGRAIDGDIVFPIAQVRRYQRDTVAGTARNFGEGVINILVRDIIAADGDVGIAAVRRQVDLPGDLYDGH